MGLLRISKLNRVRLLLFLLALPIYRELLLLIRDNYASFHENPLLFVVPASMLAPLVGLVRCLDLSESDSNKGFTRVDLATFALLPLILVLSRAVPRESLVEQVESVVLVLGGLVLLCSLAFCSGLGWAVTFRKGQPADHIVDRFARCIRALLITYPKDSLLLFLVAPLSPLLLVAVLSYLIVNLFTVRRCSQP